MGSGADRIAGTIRLLTLLDEYTRECLAIRVERRMGSSEVIGTLPDVMLWRAIPEHSCSDNGSEFLALDLRQWLGNLGTERYTSNQVVHGKKCIVRVSMGSCGMNA